MFRIARSQILPIGVDIGADSVKLIQLEVVGEQLRVVAAARHALPEDVRCEQPDVRLPVAIDLVRRLIRGGNFLGGSIVTALPREVIQVKNLRLPQMPLAELDSAVQFEARNVFLFGVDEVQVRYLNAGEVRQGNDARREVIVLAARDLDINNYLEQWHRGGVAVESLDFEPQALYRGVERYIRRKIDEQDVNVLVDVGCRRTLVVIGRGREISFYRPIDVGGQQLHEAVGRKLGITLEEARGLRRRLVDSNGAGESSPPARDPVRQAVFDATRTVVEELAREIALCLRYYSVTFRGHRPGRIRLSGGESCDPHVVSILGANLPVPVEAARPLYSVDTSAMKPQDRRGSLGEWAVALGLGLKMCGQKFGARDGKRRDPGTSRDPANGEDGATAEIVDVARAFRASVASQPADATAVHASDNLGDGAEEAVRA